MTEDKNNQAENRRNALLKYLSSEALLLAAIPVVAYLTIYVFNSGYFNVFTIPRSFIEFSIFEVFTVSGALVAVALAVFFWGDMILSVVMSLPDIIARRLRRGFIIYIIYLGLLTVIIDSQRREIWVWLAIIGAVLFLSIELVIPLISHRKVPGYQAKLRAAEKVRKSTTTKDEWKTPLEKLIAFLGPWISAVFLLLLFCYGYGRYRAIFQKSFYVFADQPTRVILWMGRESAAVSDYDPITKQLRSTISLIRLDDTDLDLQLHDIGPLIPARGGSIIFRPQSTATSTTIPTSTKPPATVTTVPTSTKPSTEDAKPTATAKKYNSHGSDLYESTKLSRNH